MNEDVTKLFCQVTTQTIYKTLGLSYDTFGSQKFIEGNLPLVYKQPRLENSVEKLTKLAKTNQTLEAIYLPYPSHIFHPRV